MAQQITEGHYKAILENPEIAESSKVGTPCMRATVRITEEGPFKGQRIAWEGWLTDGAAKRTIQSMIFAGCAFPPLPGEDEPNLEDFTGCGSKEIAAQVVIEKYTPDPTDENPEPKETSRPRVEFINPIGVSRSTKAVDANRKTMIAKQFGNLAKEALVKAAASGNSTDFNPSELDGQKDGKKKKLY